MPRPRFHQRLYMPHVDPPGDPGPPKFRRTLVRVLIVQLVALAMLGFLQLHFHG